MEIERIKPNPDNSATGAIWIATFINQENISSKLNEFKEIVYKEIHETIDEYNFSGFLWRDKPNIILKDSFEKNAIRITNLHARVTYFKNENKLTGWENVGKY